MYIFGHIAVAILVLSSFNLSFVYGVLGALIPDLIDKPLNFIGLIPYGRYMGHTGISFLITTFFILLLTKNKKITLSFLVGYLSHLLADLPFLVPFLFPFKSYNFSSNYSGDFRIEVLIFFILVDIVGFLYILYSYRRNKIFRDEVSTFLKKLKTKLDHFLDHFL